MKKAFLTSLVGKTVQDAERTVVLEGYAALVVPEECNAITSIARRRTVILWQKNGLIKSASIGDPVELE